MHGATYLRLSALPRINLRCTGLKLFDDVMTTTVLIISIQQVAKNQYVSTVHQKQSEDDGLKTYTSCD